MPAAPVAAAIAGGTQIAGGILQNGAAAAQQGAQEDFEERMSDTAYERQVVDMRDAGLNPILSANLGGASTPSIGQAPVVNPFGEAGNSALSAYTGVQNSDSSVQLNSALTAKAQADTANSLATAANTTVDTANKAAAGPGISASSDIKSKEATGARMLMPFFNSAVDAAHSVFNKLDDVVSGVNRNSSTSGSPKSKLSDFGAMNQLMSDPASNPQFVPMPGQPGVEHLAQPPMQ